MTDWHQELAMVSAIVFGFTVAFFNKWFYSDDEKIEKKDLWIIIPTNIGLLILAFTFIFSLKPIKSSINDLNLWYIFIFGVLFLFFSYIAAIIREYDDNNEKESLIKKLKKLKKICKEINQSIETK